MNKCVVTLVFMLINTQILASSSNDIYISSSDELAPVKAMPPGAHNKITFGEQLLLDGQYKLKMQIAAFRSEMVSRLDVQDSQLDVIEVDLSDIENQLSQHDEHLNQVKNDLSDQLDEMTTILAIIEAATAIPI